MTSSQELVLSNGHQVRDIQFDQTQLDLLKATVAKGTTDDQFSLFVEVAKRTGLNPFAKQIYAVIRNAKDGDKWVPTMTIQTGVDGYRLIAQRSGDYAGQRGPQWCGTDGEWRDVWLNKEHPAAARVGVLRHGFTEPVWGVATYQSYAQMYDGAPQGLWKSMPDNMLAKCAEVLALRKAFPQELSGIYSDDEMMQADREPIDRVVHEPIQEPRRKSKSTPDQAAAPKEPPFGSEDWGDEPKPASSNVLTAFFERAEALGYSEAQVLSFAQVDSLAGATREDLQGIINDLKEASGQRQMVTN